MISGSIINDDEGKEIGSIGFARDIRRMRQREQLATAGEIAVSLAHEINNPLESITNNLELLARAIEGHMKDAELATENEHLDAIRAGIVRVNAIVRRLDEMSRRGVYETRDYMNGKRMADLAPREAVTLPKHFNEHPQAAPASEQSWPLAGMAVLVLDDDVEVVTSLADVLRAERCIVHTATRPSAALGVLRNMKVDAVISDVVMPEMDGYEFYMHVKQEMPQIPVVLMTAYYYDKDHIIKRSKLKGLEGAIFKKPVNPAQAAPDADRDAAEGPRGAQAAGTSDADSAAGRRSLATREAVAPRSRLEEERPSRRSLAPASWRHALPDPRIRSRALGGH